VLGKVPNKYYSRGGSEASGKKGINTGKKEKKYNRETQPQGSPVPALFGDTQDAGWTKIRNSNNTVPEEKG